MYKNVDHVYYARLCCMNEFQGSSLNISILLNVIGIVFTLVSQLFQLNIFVYTEKEDNMQLI